MAIQYKKNRAVFDDVVRVDEAEDLLQWVQKNPDGKVDLANCLHLHAATLQVLMAAHRQIAAWPKDRELNTWLQQALKS